MAPPGETHSDKEGEQLDDRPGNSKAGMVALAGRPNVGKSTLLNELLGCKLSAASRRPQTTRNRILGIKTVGADQIVFIDTPGMHRKRSNMDRFMAQEALEGVSGVDCVVLVTEVARATRGRSTPRPRPDGGSPDDQGSPAEIEIHPEDRYALGEISRMARDVPLIVALNKIDLLRDRTRLLPLIEGWRQQGLHTVVPISALERDGLERLESEIRKLLPEGQHLYPDDIITDRAERFIAAELIREQVFVQTLQEIPYSTAVEVDLFEERADRGDICIDASIFVERASQKAIVVGHRGERVKHIGMKARQELGRLLGCPVHLKLTVRVAEDWTHSPSERRRFGYE